MYAVLMLFLLPVGGGIPAGVLLANTKGLAWPITAGLYFVSDVILAISFEPILQLFVSLGRRVPIVARFCAAMKATAARSVKALNCTGGGPLTLIMIAFGVDPMTGRATAHASGHGFITGWALAIAGDMLYYAVIAISTLRLNTYFHDPNTSVLVVLGGMIIVPKVVRYFRSKLSAVPC